MLTSLRLMGATLATSVAGLGLVGLGASPAAAECGGGSVGCSPPEAAGGTVRVTVTGTLIDPGKAGSGGSSTTVSVPVPCYRTPMWNGKDYYKGVENGTINGAGWDEWNDEPWKPYAGYKKHRKDTEGHWYVPTCRYDSDEGFFDSVDEFQEYSLKYFHSHTGVYVEANETPPVDPVPPEVLLQAATDSMTMPEPTFDHNPDLTGGQDTLVNLDTWFWLRDSTGSGYVSASAAGNTARVDATLDRVSFSAGRAGSIDCNDTGTPWARGASSDCTIAFDRAGQHRVTAETAWGLTWSYNGTPQGALDPIGAVWSDVLGVAQSQSLVTDVN